MPVKPNLLVVDDQPDHLELLTSILDSMGFEVQPALSGQRALDAVQQHLPDLILLDIMMPGMDGYEVCRQLQANPMTRDVPVIFLSALNNADQRVAAFEAGGVDYITKPFEIQEVVARINNHIKLSEQRQEIEALHQQSQQIVQQLRTEISQRERAENEQRKLLRAVEQSAHAIIITDTHGFIEYVNPQFLRVTGYTYDEIIGQKPRLLKSGYTPDDEYQRLWQTIQHGNTWNGTFRNRKKNGDLFWEYATITPVIDDNGQITHFIAIKEDITDRMLVEESLRYTLERLSVINEIMTISQRTRTLHGFIEAVCREMQLAYPGNYVDAFKLEDQRRQPLVVSSQNHIRQAQHIAADDALYSYLMHSRDLLQVYGSKHAAYRQRLRYWLGCHALKSALVMPLSHNDDCWGCIIIWRLDDVPYTDNGQTLARESIHVMTQALENILLHQQLNGYNEHLSKVVDERTGQLNRLNHRVSAILAGVTDSIILLDNHGRILNTNPGFDNTYGYYPDELFNHSILDFTFR